MAGRRKATGYGLQASAGASASRPSAGVGPFDDGPPKPAARSPKPEAFPLGRGAGGVVGGPVARRGLGGVALTESILGGGALALCAGSMLIGAGRAPARRVVGPMIAVGLATAVLLAAPFALRPLAPRTLGDLARLMSPAGLAALPKSNGR